MDKRTLNHMMDWVAWKEDVKKWYECMPYMFPSEEEFPTYYPCVVTWDSEPCSVGSQRYDLYYQFVYLSDFQNNG